MASKQHPAGKNSRPGVVWNHKIYEFNGIYSRVIYSVSFFVFVAPIIYSSKEIFESGIFLEAAHCSIPQNAIGLGVMVVFAVVAGMASIMFQLGNKYVGAQSASLLSTFEPLTSVVVGVLIYKEIMTRRSAFGILFILTAVILLSVGQNKNKE